MPTGTRHEVALVLGGGGAAGNAWTIGVLAGVVEAGLDLTEAADVMIGTSSGASAATQVRSGIPRPSCWLRCCPRGLNQPARTANDHRPCR